MRSAKLIRIDLPQGLKLDQATLPPKSDTCLHGVDFGVGVLEPASIESSSPRRRPCHPILPCELFLEFSRRKLFEQYWPRLRKAVEPLSDEQIWWRPNEASNSIGNLILHLNGNVWQWLVASFDRLEDNRDRPAEFNATGDLSAADLLARLGQTLDEAAKVLARLDLGGIACNLAYPGIHR